MRLFAKKAHFCIVRKMVLYIFCLASIYSQAQEKKKREKFPAFFAIHGNAIIPNTFQKSKGLIVEDSITRNTITQNVGRSFGAYLRRSYTNRFSLEAGILYSSRNFDVSMEVKDSNIVGKTTLKFTTYDIPLNALVLLKMSQNIFANAALGVVLNYRPSAIGVVTVLENKHVFAHSGLLNRKFAFDFNGQIGVELRTIENGYFYLGGSVRVPLADLFVFQARYKYDSNSTSNFGKFQGGFISVDLRYYFHAIKNKGAQPIEGPMRE